MTHISPSLPTSSSLPYPSTSSLSLTSPLLPLEIGPLNAARGLGNAVSSPIGSGRSLAAKQDLVHFGLKNASGESNFKGKNMFVFSLFTSNNATSLGEAQIGQHINAM